VDPRRVWDPQRIAPSGLATTVAIGIQAGVAICSPVGWFARCAQDQVLQADGTVASEEDHSNRERGSGMCAKGPDGISTCSPNSAR